MPPLEYEEMKSAFIDRKLIEIISGNPRWTELGLKWADTIVNHSPTEVVEGELLPLDE